MEKSTEYVYTNINNKSEKNENDWVREWNGKASTAKLDKEKMWIENTQRMKKLKKKRNCFHP